MDLELVRAHAEIELFDASVSGKTSGYSSGVRPNHLLPGQRHFIPGAIEFDGQEFLSLGGKCTAVVSFLVPRSFERLTVGTTWRLHEGSNHVGNGKILRLLA